MSLLIFSDTVNTGAYGYAPSSAGLFYIKLSNLTSQSSTVTISVNNNGVSTVVSSNIIISSNSSYESPQFSLTADSIITIQSTTQLNLNLYSYYANYEETPYEVDYEYSNVLSGQVSSSITNSGQTTSVILANLQTQLENINNEYLLLLQQYGNISTTLNITDTNVTALTTNFSSMSSEFINISNQINRVAITQNQAIIQGTNNVFQYVSSQEDPTSETVSNLITLQGPTSGSVEYMIVKNSIYQKLFFNFNNYLNNSSVPMTIDFPYSYIYNPYVNDNTSSNFTYNENSISFNGSPETINGSLVLEGLISNETNNTDYYEVNGTTSGSIIIYYTVNGNLTKYTIVFKDYVNSTSEDQEVTLPAVFNYTPLVSNTSGLSISTSTSTITIISPNSTNPVNGTVILEGI